MPSTEPIVREIYIEAKPEVVFEFFVDAEKLTRWLATEATLDPRPGGVCRQLHPGDGDPRSAAGPFHMEGEFLEVEPPSRVVFTWGFAEPVIGVPPGSSTVEVTLRAVNLGTQVRLVHSGLSESETGNHADGWIGMLERLAAAVGAKQTIRHEVWINADRSTVFEAIATKKGLDAWWGEASEFEPASGSIIEFDHGLGAPLRMRILELIPDSRVVWECLSEFDNPANPASDWPGSRISFDLRSGGPTGFEPIDATLGDTVTIVDFQHAGWPPGARWFGFCNHAWGTTLQTIAQHCEGDQS